MSARDELEEYGFSPTVSEILDGNIHRPFPDFVIVAEETIGKGGPLTRSQLIHIESLYRRHNIGREREIWEGLKRTRERRLPVRRPAVRREVVFIFGRKVVVYRSLLTGRFVGRRRRR